jgi:hypothetical protein
MDEKNEKAVAKTFGAKWPDRYGALKHLEVDPAAQVGDFVTIPNTKDGGVYGPYEILFVTNPGGAVLTKDALCVSRSTKTRTKALTKDELQQLLAQQTAELEKLKAAQKSK